jgi:putative intracellular protease/amidase
MTDMTVVKGKIGILIEEHFDLTEYRLFNKYFPEQGYVVEYMSHLWGNASLKFGSNPDHGYVEEEVEVTVEVNQVNPADYAGIIVIGGYASDRLRYQATVKPGQKNQAPAVVFLRRAMALPAVKKGAICHSLWLFCADSDLLRNRKVTCAHNVICDVENAGAEIVYEGEGTIALVVDGDLITGKHPGVTEQFMAAFVAELEIQQRQLEMAR